MQVLWIANFRQIKQPDVFVKLAKECRHTGVRFIMLGRTQGYEKLVAKAESYGVEVLGEVSNDDVNLLLEKSHVLVNTSIQEGFSNTFIQAWMRRAPVVSLHVDPDGILQREKIGSNCSGCFGRLVKETERLIRDHDLRNQMGANARTYAVKNYSLTNFSKILCLMEDYR
ncbi:MAG: hypothetical protein CSA18_04870 [Deltaproteobacteria bacterium]|nr:MAG: hypothetical protein CSA18_04870 [Deltaproteobacteria bacterium]